jgi:hypothetical protein
MLGRHYKSRFLSRTVAVIIPTVLTTSCAVPSLNVAPALPAAPTVAQLQNHLTCVLARAMNRHLGPEIANIAAGRDSEDYKLWRRLVDYNFLDAVNFTLFVTQSQGLNPSFNFITPLTSLGHSVEKVIESSNGLNSPQNVTTNTNNFTLSVGFQLNGTQDHNFVVTYTIDMHKLYDAMYATTDGRLARRAGGVLDTCDRLDETRSEKGIPYGLKGDLALEETLATGLGAMQTARYSPATAGSGGGAKASQQASSASVSQSAGATAFSSKIDFSLQWGINGGPSWSLLKFKGPSAGGSGANGQLLSYSRSKQDSLISTFAATCKSDKYLNLGDGKLYFEPEAVLMQADASYQAFQINAYLRRTPDDGADPSKPLTLLHRDKDDPEMYRELDRQYIITVAIPTDKSGLRYYYSGNVTGAISIDALPFREAGPRPFESKNGTIAWSVFVTKNDAATSYSLRGAVSDAQSGTFLGYIYAAIRVQNGKAHINNLSMSQNAVDLLIGEDRPGPPDFWSSLPSCATSGPFLVNGLNILQQLPGDVSSTLQQQR